GSFRRNNTALGTPLGGNRWLPQKACALCRKLRRSSSAVATSREGHHSRACSLGTPQQLALRLFQGAPRPYWDCPNLRQLLKFEWPSRNGRFEARKNDSPDPTSRARKKAPGVPGL